METDCPSRQVQPSKADPKLSLPYSTWGLPVAGRQVRWFHRNEANIISTIHPSPFFWVEKQQHLLFPGMTQQDDKTVVIIDNSKLYVLVGKVKQSLKGLLSSE